MEKNNNAAWRHDVVYRLIGSIYDGGGTAEILLLSGNKRRFSSSNLAKRLDNILYQLMLPAWKKVNNKWIEEERKLLGRGYTKEEVEDLNVWVIRRDEKV